MAKRKVNTHTIDAEIEPMEQQVEETPKVTSETRYNLAGQTIQVYTSEGKITRFLLNDAGNNAFEMTIEGE